MDKKKPRSVASFGKFGNPFDEPEDDSIVEEVKEEIPSIDFDKTISSDVEQNQTGGFLDQFYEKKETREDTHTRKTFLVENNLLDEIKKYTKKLGYGFQVKFINEAIRKQLEVIKEDEMRLKSKRRK